MRETDRGVRDRGRDRVERDGGRGRGGEERE